MAKTYLTRLIAQYTSITNSYVVISYTIASNALAITTTYLLVP